ncbi:hypothetical protein GCM10022381_18690 [Leifsonia kafniensis]|uniref:Uncharacterized protein n=1 Tax=Leifsonia kafniensis TaxID=475957 RepID=A0ABP7KGJ0_9MICO
MRISALPAESLQRVKAVALGEPGASIRGGAADQERWLAIVPGLGGDPGSGSGSASGSSRGAGHDASVALTGVTLALPLLAAGGSVLASWTDSEHAHSDFTALTVEQPQSTAACALSPGLLGAMRANPICAVSSLD